MAAPFINGNCNAYFCFGLLHNITLQQFILENSSPDNIPLHIISFNILSYTIHQKLHLRNGFQYKDDIVMLLFTAKKVFLQHSRRLLLQKQLFFR
jgi:hypothetical protein